MANILLALGLFILSLLPVFAFADDAPKPLAVIWNGKGNCRMVCVDGAKAVAEAAGYRFLLVDEDTRDFSFFRRARVWIQPGGFAGTQARYMGPVLMRELRDFIARGGGYVGFCAGAFLSTAKVGSTEVDGLGIVPGRTQVLRGLGSPNMLRVNTASRGQRWMYFAGGAFLEIPESLLTENEGMLNAHYSNGTAAGYQGRFGLGKVSVTGFHPEASSFWKSIRGQRDNDGSDVAYAADMVRWAGTPEARAPRPVPQPPRVEPVPQPEPQQPAPQEPTPQAPSPGEDTGTEDGGEGDAPETEGPDRP